MRQGGLILAADRVRSKKKKKTPHHKNTRRNPQQPGARDHLETARRNTSHVSSYSSASIDPGFMEIGLVQLSQQVKTTNITHAYSDTQTDRLIYKKK